jgi:hypothetical protein
MKRIIVFRFHAHPTLCENRLRCIKQFNPSVEIYGLFGGAEKDYRKFHKKLMPYLVHCYCIKNKTKRWKWKHGDLALRRWYTDFGNTLSFDMLHLIEWDLLLMDSLDSIYRGIPGNGIGLTSLVPLQEVASRWIWTAEEPHKGELANLLAWVHDRFDYSQQPYGSQGPGLCLPKQFLEAYCNIEIPELCNDEVRVPLFGQILGFEMYDTHFCDDWFARVARQTFHCQTQIYPAISLSTIRRELAESSGKRVFHPFRGIVILDCADYARSFLIAAKEVVRSSSRYLLSPLLTRFLNKKRHSREERAEH